MSANQSRTKPTLAPSAGPLADVLPHVEPVQAFVADQQALASRMMVVSQLALALNHTLDAGTIYRVLGQSLYLLLPFDHASLCLLDAPEAVRWINLAGPPLAATGTQADGLVGRVLDSGNPELRNNGAAAAAGAFAAYGSALVVPLEDGTRVFGTLNFASRAAHAFTLEDMQFAHMAGLHLAAALQNAAQMAVLQARIDEMNEINQELDAYNHTVAHDLKAPLGLVMGYSEFLLSDFELGDLAEHIEVMHRATIDMTGIIEQLSHLASLEAVEEAVVPVDMDAALDVALHRFAKPVQSEDIHIDLPEVMPAALGHTTWIEEILANILSNAIEYGSQGNPDLHIVIQAQPQEDGLTCCYTIQDNGPGIPADRLDSLFQKFTRLAPDDIEGTGLGLAIVRRLVHKLGGEIGVESAPGEGSRFWFTLPLAEPAS